MSQAPPGSQIIIKKPDDFHVHLRSGEMLSLVAPYTASKFARAAVMPNLIPPVTTTEQALKYKEEIIKAAANPFTPLMTIYLTEETSSAELEKAKESGIIGFKLYPAGATTNSDSGVREIENVYAQLETMQKLGLVFLMHGEVSDEEVEFKDREKVFLETHLQKLAKDFPGLRMVLEHVSTKDGVDFVKQASENIAATCTVHHMMFTDQDLYSGGLNSHLYCMPVLKSEEDRQAVIAAATSSSPKFFAGTDSAPHLLSKKEGKNPSAGIFTAPVALECYTQIFDEADLWNGETLENLEDFLSTRGAKFYGLPENQETVTLLKESSAVPAEIPAGNDKIIPLLAGEETEWSVKQ